MRTLVFPMLFGCLLFKQCSMPTEAVSPESVRQKTEDGLRQYFPHVHAAVDPQRHAILALTCTANIGRSAIEKMAPMMQNDPDIGQLKTLRVWGPAIGAPTYKYLFLGFDEYAIGLDVDTWQVSVLQGERIIHGYQHMYAQTCELSSRSASTGD
ncbi:MAG TPA: hypothetical protein VFA76_12955 [Terriglobales bacterium]|nr:hypothetical protein [Terriglobales bacterium]